MKQKETPETYTSIYKTVPAKSRFYTFLSLAEIEKCVDNYCNYKEYDTLIRHTQNSTSIIANENRLHINAIQQKKGVKVEIEMNDFDTFIQQFLPEKYKHHFNLQKHKWGFDLAQYQEKTTWKEYFNVQKDDGYGCIVFPSFIFCLGLLMLIWGLIFQSVLGGIFILLLLYVGLWYAHKMAQEVEMETLHKKLKALEIDSPYLDHLKEETTLFYLVEELDEAVVSEDADNGL